eukprot:scaffold946_cov171-Ochromonas_danica.AAC.12
MKVGLVSSTQAYISFNVTLPGIIHCAAFSQASAYSLESVLQISNVGSRQLIAAAGTVNMTLSNLSPETTYDIYCYSEDFSSNLMPLVEAIATKVSVNTSCCRQLLAIAYPASIPQYTGSSSESLFQIALNAAPTGQTRLNLPIYPCSSALSTTSVVAYPSLFTFYPNSSTLTAAFVVRGTTVGCYVIQATATGSTSYSPVNITFTLRNIRITPPAPNLTAVVYSNDGNSLYFGFDSNSDRGASVLANYNSYFNCSLLVTFTGSSRASCAWLNNTYLVATLKDTTSFPVVGQKAVVRGNIIRAQCSSGSSAASCSTYSYMAAVSLPILAPPKPAIPIAVLSTASSIYSCDDITLDPTASKGSGLRGWVSVRWTVNGTASAMNNSQLTDFLNTYASSTANNVTIPNEYFVNHLFPRDTPHLYTFSLTLIDYFQQVTRVSVNVTMVSDTSITPKVSLYSQFSAYVPSQVVRAVAVAILPACLGYTSSNLTLQYYWYVYQGVEYKRSIVSTSRDPTVFVAPGYSFAANQNYTLKVRVSVKGSGNIGSTADTILSFGRSGVSAIILGANVFTTSQRISLDASQSSDLDNSGATLTYLWSCTSVSASYGSACSNFPTTRSKITQSQLNLAVGTLDAGTYYINVTTTSSVSGLASSTGVAITILSRGAPSVTIASVKAKYSAGDKIILSGTVNASVGAAYAYWSSDRIDTTASSVVISPWQTSVQSGVWAFSLAIAPYGLSQGLSYTFSLNAAYKSSLTIFSMANITVNINSPPSLGSLSISPSTGSALSTIYVLTAGGWQDDSSDLPLTYVFLYWILPNSSISTLQGRSQISYLSTMLGQGLQSSSYSVTCAARIYDIYDAMANTTVNVQVFAGPTLSSYASTVQTSLTNALANRDASQVLQTASIALSSLNAVDCTTSVSCSTLNRQKCSTTARTCGPCLSGYVGVTGDANLPCNVSSSLRNIEQSCSSNYSCATGFCKAGVCVDSPKLCPGNCLGRGKCTYLDLLGKLLSYCSILNSACEARCVCNSGYYGISCSLSSSDYPRAVTLREQLCASLYSSTTMEDVSMDSVTSRATTVANVLLDPYQLTPVALANCTLALVASIDDLGDLSCQDSTFDLLSRALSSILLRSYNLSLSVVDVVDRSAKALSSTCSNFKVVGESSSQSVTSTLRLLSFTSTGSSLLSTRVTLPQTGFESFLNVSPAAFMVRGGTLWNSSNLVKVTLRQFQANPRRDKAISSGVSVELVLSSVQESRRRLLSETSSVMIPLQTDTSEYVFYLPNREFVNYTAVEAKVIRVRCYEVRSTTYNLSVNCPLGEVVSVQCPSNSKGVYNVTCPGYTTFPVCATWNGSAFASDTDSCRVLQFDGYSTTCSCSSSIASSSSGRRLSTNMALMASSSVSFELASLWSTEYSDLSIDYTPSPGLLEVHYRDATTATMYALFASLVVGLLLTGFADWNNSKNKMKKHNKYESGKESKVRLIYKLYDEIFPLEFREGRWYQLFWIKICNDHSILSLFMSLPLSAHRPNQSMRWLLGITKLISVVAFSTILVRITYPDNDYCDRFDNESSCNSADIIGGWDNRCKWVADNETCIFDRPAISFMLLLIMSGVVLFFVNLCYSVCKFLQKRIALHWNFTSESMQKAVVPVSDDDVTVFKRLDEFMEAQTLRSTLLRAARLEKAKLSMDNNLPSEEAALLAFEIRTAMAHWENHRVFGNAVDQAYFHRMRYGLSRVSEKDLLNRVILARRDALGLCRLLESRLKVDQREPFLLRSFIVNCFQGADRLVVENFFFPPHLTFSPSLESSIFCYGGLIVWFGILAVFLVLIMILGKELGSRALDLWAAVIVVAFVEEIFLLEPVSLWMQFNVIGGSVSADVRSVSEQLLIRSRLILLRTSGLLREANALVQHFNPACRAARMFPSWPISRLLFSVNDRDLPLCPENSLILLPWRKLLALLKILVFGLGDLFGQIALGIIILGCVQCLAAGLYFLGLTSAGGAWGVVGALAFIVISHEVRMFAKAQHRRILREKQVNDEVFKEVIAQPIVEEQQSLDKQASVSRNLRGNSVLSFQSSGLVRKLSSIEQFSALALGSPKSNLGRLEDFGDDWENEDEEEEEFVHRVIIPSSSRKSKSGSTRDVDLDVELDLPYRSRSRRSSFGSAATPNMHSGRQSPYQTSPPIGYPWSGDPQMMMNGDQMWAGHSSISGPPLSASNNRVFGPPQAARPDIVLPMLGDSQFSPSAMGVMDKTGGDGWLRPTSSQDHPFQLEVQTSASQRFSTGSRTPSRQRSHGPPMLDLRPDSRSQIIQRKRRRRPGRKQDWEDSDSSSTSGDSNNDMNALRPIRSRMSTGNNFVYRKYSGRLRHRQALLSNDDKASPPKAGPGSQAAEWLVDERHRVEQSRALLSLQPNSVLPPLDLYSGGNELFTPRSSVDGSMDSRNASINNNQTNHLHRAAAAARRRRSAGYIASGSQGGEDLDRLPRAKVVTGPGSILTVEFATENNRAAFPMYDTSTSVMDPQPLHFAWS